MLMINMTLCGKLLPLSVQERQNGKITLLLSLFIDSLPLNFRGSLLIFGNILRDCKCYIFTGLIAKTRKGLWLVDYTYFKYFSTLFYFIYFSFSFALLSVEQSQDACLNFEVLLQLINKCMYCLVNEKQTPLSPEMKY